jgi:HK97 family phage major capsid protein
LQIQKFTNSVGTQMTIEPMAAVRTAVENFTAETNEAVGGLKRQVAALTAAQDRTEAVLRRPGFAANDNAPQGEIKAEYKALSSYIRSGDESGLKEYRAAMSVGSDPDGGYLVLPTMSAGMTRKLFDLVTMRRLARVEIMTTGDRWQEPIDFDEIGANWVGEQQARPETDSAELKMLSINLDEIYALTKVTQRLLDDAAFDVANWADQKIADKFGRSENAAMIAGDGIGKPRGFLTYPQSETADATRPWGEIETVRSLGATSITADSLRNLYWKLRAPYRQGATWVMSSETANSIDKLKDGNGDYLWRAGMTEGAQPKLLGLPVEIDEMMPSVAAGTTPIAIANWKSAYVVVDRPGIRPLRDPFTAKPHCLFYAYKRVGGGLANSEAIKLLKIMA